MDKAAVLARLDRHLLEAYSRRTVAALHARLPLPFILPWLERLLALNVAKEVRKDTLTIARAAAGTGVPEDEVVASLLRETQAIDRDFLSSVGGAPLKILIRYEEIDPVRGARIRRLLGLARLILAAWEDGHGLRAALEASLPGAALEAALADLLLLHAEETRMLGAAVRMPALFAPLRRRAQDALYETMAGVARELAREATERRGGGFRTSPRRVAGASPA
jgi:hypothetical protein